MTSKKPCRSTREAAPYNLETEQRAEKISQESRKTRRKLRLARRERIAAGKPETFDCSSEEDVVCPHCGTWFEGKLLAVRRGSGAWHEMRCMVCRLTFHLMIQVRYSFTTVKEHTPPPS